MRMKDTGWQAAGSERVSRMRGPCGIHPLWIAVSAAAILFALSGCVYTNPRFMAPMPLYWQPEDNRAYLFTGGMAEKMVPGTVCELYIRREGGERNTVMIPVSRERGAYFIQIEEGEYVIHHVDVLFPGVAPLTLPMSGHKEAAFTARRGRITYLGYVFADFTIMGKSFLEWRRDDYSTFMKSYWVPTDAQGRVLKDVHGEPLYRKPITVPASFTFWVTVNNVDRARQFIANRYSRFAALEVSPACEGSTAPILRYEASGTMMRGQRTFLAFERSEISGDDGLERTSRVGLAAHGAPAVPVKDQPAGLRMSAFPGNVTLRREGSARLGWTIKNTLKENVYFYDQFYPVFLYVDGREEYWVGMYGGLYAPAPLIPALPRFTPTEDQRKWMGKFITLKPGEELTRVWTATYKVVNGKRLLVLSGEGDHLTIDVGTFSRASFRFRYQQYPANREIVASVAREKKLVANATRIVTDVAAGNLVEIIFKD